MARVQGMTPEGIRKAIAEAIAFIKDLNVEDLNKLLAAFEDANGIFDVRLVEAREEVKKAEEKALEAEAQAKLIVEELARYQELQDAEAARILAEVATAIEAANLASDQLPALFERLTTAEAGLDFANTEFDTLIVKQDEFRDAVAEQTAEVARLNTEFVAVNQAVTDAVEKVDQSTIKVNQIGGDLELARANLDAKIKKNQEDITAAQTLADEHQNAIDTLTGNLDGLTTDYSTLSSNFSTSVENLKAVDASLLSNMDTKVGDLRATTDAQAAAISAAKVQAEKGVSDAAAAKSAADQAALDATNKSNAAREAAELYAKEKSEADVAASLVASAAEALRVAKLQADEAKAAAATDAKDKADEAERLAKLYAEAQAQAAKETAEANAALDATNKANKAKEDAEANAKLLSDKAQQAAEEAQARADKGVTDAAAALARANEANNKLPAITSDVAEAARVAAEAANALPDIRAEVSTAKTQAAQGISDAAAAKSAVDNLQIGGRNLAEKSVNVVDRLGSPTGSRREYSNFDMGTPYASVPEGVDITISFDLEMVFNHDTVRTLQVYCSNRRGPKGFLARTLKFDDIPQGETFKGRVHVNTKSTIPDSQTNDTCFVEFYSIYLTDNWYKVTNLKVERGNKATDWTPAPEDVDSAVSAAQTAANEAKADAKAVVDQIPNINTKISNLTAEQTTLGTKAQQGIDDAKVAADLVKNRVDVGSSLVGLIPGTTRPAWSGGMAPVPESENPLGLIDAYVSRSGAVGNHEYVTVSASDKVKYRVSFWLKASEPGSDLVFDARSPVSVGGNTLAFAGNEAVDGALNPGDSGRVFWVKNVPTEWTYYEGVKTPAQGLKHFYIGTRYWRHNGGSNRTADQYVADLRIEPVIPSQDAVNKLLIDTAQNHSDILKAQADINTAQGEINDNNSAFQTWQREVNNRRDIWEKASTDATKALSRFAITQAQWNTLSSTATNANTKAIASHAALFEGQNKWNAVATAAIESQATLLAKQARWSDGVDKALAWQDQLNNSQSDINKTTTAVLANQAKWNSAQLKVNDSQSEINRATQSVLLNQSKWNTAQEKVNNDQSELNKAVKVVQDKQLEWNDGVTKALASHTELFKTTSKTFKAVKAVNDNQTKWNNTASDLITTNSNVSAANKTAIEGLNRVLGLRTSSSNVVPMVPGGVRTGGTDIAPIFTPTPAWMTKGSRVTVTDIPGITSIDAIKQTGQATHQFEPYYSEIDPTIEYKYSYWARANVTGTRIYIELRSGESTAFPIESNTQDNHSSAGQYLAGNVLLTAGWKQYTGTIRFKPDVRTIYFKAIYYNHPNGVAGTQTIADIQIYPNIPSQADVNKALTDSDAAQNTLLAKYGEWSDAASRSIATVESLWGKTDTEVGELNKLTEDLGDRITKQGEDFSKSVSEMFTNIPRVAYAMDGQSIPASDTDGFVKILRYTSGNFCTRVDVEAVGNWVGSMIVEGDHGRSDGFGKTYFNSTPIRKSFDVLSGTRLFRMWRNTDVDHIGAVKVTYFVKPGKVVPIYPSGGEAYPDQDKWKVLFSEAAPETTDYNIALNVTWAATTYNDQYGVRIRVGSNVVSQIKRNEVGPLFPGQSGVRAMSIGASQVRVPAGTKIYLEAYSNAGGSTQRRISKWSGQMSYITSGRG